jgi:hypothetical protein
MAEFASVLVTEQQRAIAAGEAWNRILAHSRAIEAIPEASKPGMTKLSVQHAGKLFSIFMQNRGYDGLKAWEGGEGGIGPHASYVIFDPSKLQVIAEHYLRM